jgi:hypothetical protein
MNTINKLTTAVICGLVLTACGGGGGDDTPEPANGTGSNGNTSTSPSNPGSSNQSSTGGSNTGGSTGSGSGSTGNGSGSTGSGSGTSDTQASYTVTPSVNGSGGTISPGAVVSVKSGAATAFQVTPNAGYTASVGGTCGGTLSGTTYTTNTVTANCTVVATFASKPLTFMYEGQPVAADAASFLALVNREGVKGYRYLYDQSFLRFCTADMYSTCESSYSPPVSVFVNDGSAPSYTYDLLPNPANINDFITQANTEGAKGYQYMGWNGITPGTTTPTYALYRKDGGSTATYTYAVDTAGPMASNAFLSQANTRGQSGYWFYGRISRAYPVPANLYVKNNTSNATYTYHTQALGLATTPPSVDQINAEGANGYHPIFLLTPNADINEGDSFTMLYIKDQTQSATFTIQSVASLPIDGTALIARLNSYGAQGYASWMNNQYLYFFKATNCSSGWLCTVD